MYILGVIDHKKELFLTLFRSKFTQSEGSSGGALVQFFGLLAQDWGVVHDFQSCDARRINPLTCRLGKPGMNPPEDFKGSLNNIQGSLNFIEKDLTSFGIELWIGMFYKDISKVFVWLL